MKGFGKSNSKIDENFIFFLVFILSPVILFAKDYSGVYKNGNMTLMIEKSENVFEIGCKFSLKTKKDLENINRDALDIYYNDKRIEDEKFSDKYDKEYQKKCKTLKKLDSSNTYAVNFKNTSGKKLNCLYFTKKIPGVVNDGNLEFGNPFSPDGILNIDGDNFDLVLSNAHYRKSGFDCDRLAGTWIKQ